MSMRIPTFLLVPFCVCICVALSPFISQFRACLFLYTPCIVPSHFYHLSLLINLSICSPKTPQTLIIVFYVLFSV